VSTIEPLSRRLQALDNLNRSRHYNFLRHLPVAAFCQFLEHIGVALEECAGEGFDRRVSIPFKDSAGNFGCYVNFRSSARIAALSWLELRRFSDAGVGAISEFFLFA
jgi:hypothetical protein